MFVKVLIKCFVDLLGFRRYLESVSVYLVEVICRGFWACLYVFVEWVRL